MRPCRATIVPLLLLTGAAQAGEPPDVEHRLSVRQHEALPQPLTEDRVDEILDEMSNLVEIQEADGDVACTVRFVRFGPLGTFTNEEIPFSVSSRRDFRRLGDASGSIKVVGEINWCGRLGASIIGCASTPGPAMAVVRHAPGQEAILWAHEFAHTTGSPHRDVPGQLMRPVIRTDLREINQAECDRILNTVHLIHPETGVPVAAESPSVVQAAEEGSGTGATAGPEAMSATAAPEEEGPPATMMTEQAPSDRRAAGPPESVSAFVNETYFEGVPFHEASRYTDDHVPELAAILDNPAQQGAWGNAVATLGAIGTERAKQELLDFLFEDPRAELSAAEYLAKANVPVALGWLVAKSGDGEALELLIKATNGDWWAEEANIDWNTPIHQDRESLIASLVTKAIIGLTLSGTEQARVRLEQLQAQLDPNAPAAALSDDEAVSLSGLSPEARSSVTTVSPVTREAVAKSGGESFLEGQLDELGAVQAGGIGSYYAQ